MYSQLLLSALGGLALVNAQVTPLIDGTIDGPVVPGTTGKLGNAAITESNPSGVTYQAILPNSNTTTIRGYIAGTSNSNGTGVVFNVNFYGFPSESLGPFLYHIHDQPVPADGNCTGTLAHLDPYQRGEIPPCDSTQPETCQVGDLSGKHGNITTSPFQTTYLELYTSTQAGIGSFFGNRSINIHTSNTTRLTCANFTLVAGTPSNVTTSSPSPHYTGAATANFVSAGAVLAGLAAFFL
ncbi:hypothetical protein MMC12_002677 [Toensbergia leucococca]|nr:hypothetical protein [Toensbergia leucococca]